MPLTLIVNLTIFYRNSFVTFELFNQGNNTLLKLTHEGLETFPEDNRDFAKGNFVEGWNHIINTSLKEYLQPIVLMS